LYAKGPQGQNPAAPTGRTGGGPSWKATLTPPANAFGKPRRNDAKSKPPAAAKNFYFKYMKTPQTDDIARGNHVVPVEWAQQLERERDEAREALTSQKIVIAQHKVITDLMIERDEAREEVRLLKAILDLLKRDALGLSQLADCIEDDNQ